jgi:hypothetical protein
MDRYRGLGCNADPARLVNLVDTGRNGFAGLSKRIVWYTTRMGYGGVSDIRFSIPFQAKVKVDEIGHADWRAMEARRVLQRTGADAIYLNHKFHQYGQPYYLGSELHPDVDTIARTMDMPWTGAPDDPEHNPNFGFPEYVRGWKMQAEALHRAGVPYAVVVGGAEFRDCPGIANPPTWTDGRCDDLGDDLASAQNESALIREVIEQADYVWLDAQNWSAGINQAHYEGIANYLESLVNGPVVFRMNAGVAPPAVDLSNACP